MSEINGAAASNTATSNWSAVLVMVCATASVLLLAETAARRILTSAVSPQLGGPLR